MLLPNKCNLEAKLQCQREIHQLNSLVMSKDKMCILPPSLFLSTLSLDYHFSLFKFLIP